MKSYVRLSSITYLFWLGTAATVYFNVFLQKNGFTAAQVGVINAINSVITIGATPFWGMMSDKFRSIRNILLFTIGFSILFWALVPGSLRIYIGPVALVYLVVPMGCFFRSSYSSLMDAYLVQRCDRDGLTYGSIRLWGSVSYAITNMAYFFILPHTGVNVTFYLYGFTSLPFIILMWKSRDPDVAASGGQRKVLTFRQMGFGRLFRNYYFITFLFFSLFLYLSNTTSNVFMPYLMQSVGGETASFGLITGFKAMLEVVPLFFMHRLRKRFPLPVLITCAAVFYCVEALLYANATSIVHLLLIQILCGLGGGFLIGSSANYLYSLSPPELTSTAQTMNGALQASAAIIGNLVGGNLIVAVGIRRFYMMVSTTMFFAIIFFVFTLFLGIRVLNKKLPSGR
jgi:PPP family 3-phenylpropionic acid transporter